MHKKYECFKCFFGVLVSFERVKDRSEIKFTCDCLRKLVYAGNRETEELARRLVFLVCSGVKMDYHKRAAIRFLKHVDPGFLRDMLLGAPKGTVRRMFASIPRKEMERIASRISEEVLFLELAKALSSFEIRIIFNLRKTG